MNMSQLSQEDYLQRLPDSQDASNDNAHNSSGNNNEAVDDAQLKSMFTQMDFNILYSKPTRSTISSKTKASSGN